MKETYKLGLAMFCEAYPCNPRPFAYGLLKYLLNQGAITDRPAKRILHTLTGILEGQLFFFMMKDIMAKIGEVPKNPIQVLQEMETMAAKPEFLPEDWKPLLSHLILAAYRTEGYYDSMAEHTNLHPLKDKAQVEISYTQEQEGEILNLHLWETDLPKTEEEIHEAVSVTGLCNENPITYEIFQNNCLFFTGKLENALA